MAIKGKKKSKSRASSAHRRPAASGARPPVSAVHSVPWHRSMGGQLTMIVIALGLIGFVMWRVSEGRAADTEREARQTELKNFTTDVGGLITTVEEPVREMMGAAFNTANPEAIAALTEDTKSWITDLETAGATAQTLAPPEGMAPAAQVLQQSFLLYLSAAKTYALVPGEDDNKRAEQLIQRSTEQRDQAGRLMTATLGILDDARSEAGMTPAGIPAPASMTPILPSPAPTASAGADDKKDGGKGSNDG